MAMTSVSVAKLKDGLSRYLARVRKGEEIAVISHREKIAKIVPIEKTLKLIPAVRPASDLKKIKGIKLSKPFDPLADLLADRRKR